MADGWLVAVLGGAGGLVGSLVGDLFAWRRYVSERADARLKAAADEVERQQEHARQEASERRANTKDDYPVILAFLDELERCLDDCAVALSMAQSAGTTTQAVVEQSQSVHDRLLSLVQQSNYSLAIEHGATDDIRFKIRRVKESVYELIFELSIGFGFQDLDLNEPLAEVVGRRTRWLRGTIIETRQLVRSELNVR